MLVEEESSQQLSIDSDQAELDEFYLKASVSEYDGKTVDEWTETELKYSKTAATARPEVSWGRQVLQAIDLDDFIELAHLMDTKHFPFANINLQITNIGYNGYLWTVRVHDYIGDTALHLSVRQKRLYCTYMLLYLGADPLLANAAGVNADELIASSFHSNHDNMRYDSKRKLVDKADPADWKRLPRSFACSTAELEAWRLAQQGRLLYNEGPKTLGKQRAVNPSTIVSSKVRHRLSFNLRGSAAMVINESIVFDPTFPPSYSSKVAPYGRCAKLLKKSLTSTKSNTTADDQTNYYSTNEKMAQTSAFVYEQTEQALQEEWQELWTEEGQPYYFCARTGESSWEKPPPPSLEEIPFTQAPDASVAVQEEQYQEQEQNLEQQQNNSFVVSNEEQEAVQAAAAITYQLSLLDKRRQEENAKLQRYHNLIDESESEELESHEKRSTHSGSLPLIDVWARGRIDDVLIMLQRQQENQRDRTRPPTQFAASGLSLLPQSTSAMQPSLSGKHQREDGIKDMEAVLKAAGLSPAYANLKGLQKLKGGLGLTSLAQLLPANNKIASSSKGITSMKSDFQQSSGNNDNDDHSPRADSPLRAAATSFSFRSSQQRAVSEPDRQREQHERHREEITVLSTRTNMKYMAVGNEGARRLAAVLEGDSIVKQLVLSAAKIGDTGIVAIAKIIPTMPHLSYLDLSSNSCTDKGAIALAAALRLLGQQEKSNIEGKSSHQHHHNYHQLQVLILSANRIGLQGCIALIEAALALALSLSSLHHLEHNSRSKNHHHHGRHRGGLRWLDLRLNHNGNDISNQADKESLLKLLEERDYEALTLSAAGKPRFRGDKSPPMVFRHRRDSDVLINNHSLELLGLNEKGGGEEHDSVAFGGDGGLFMFGSDDEQEVIDEDKDSIIEKGDSLSLIDTNHPTVKSNSPTKSSMKGSGNSIRSAIFQSRKRSESEANGSSSSSDGDGSSVSQEDNGGRSWKPPGPRYPIILL